MRAVVSVCFGLSVLAISAAAFAQEGGVIPAAPVPAPAEPVVAPAPASPVVAAPAAPVVAPAAPVVEAPAPKAPVRNTAFFLVGGELERIAYRGQDYVTEWKPTSVGARVGFLIPTDRRAFERRRPEIAIVGSIGLRTAITSRTTESGYYGGYSTFVESTENLTIPIELGVRSTPAPGAFAGYLEGGLRILMRHVSRTATTYDGSGPSAGTTTTKTHSWEDAYVGLALGGGVRIERFEIGLHVTALSNDGRTGELGIGLRGGYYFSQL